MLEKNNVIAGNEAIHRDLLKILQHAGDENRR
jgi:hypothetical protein